MCCYFMLHRQVARTTAFPRRTHEQASTRPFPTPAAAVLAVLGSCAILLLLASTLAFAGSDDSCPLGQYEVDDDFSAIPDVPACKYQTIQEVLLLALTPSDRISIHNGTSTLNANITTDGLSFVGESQAGVHVTASTATNSTFSIQAADTNLTNMTVTGNVYGI